MKKKVILNVEGMSCSSCATTVSRYLEKEGLKDVNVNFTTGESVFTIENENKIPLIIKGINSLGYHVVEHKHENEQHSHNHSADGLSGIEKKFYFSLIFTVPLLLSMFLPFYFLHHTLVQLFLCMPVIILGLLHFGKSAWGSIKIGIPNMDVLIALGSNAAFIYSLIGTIQYYGTAQVHQYLFYETAATIISLVLLGNVMEHRSVRQTTTAIEELSKMQVVKAKKLIHDNPNEYLEINYN